MQKFEIQSEMEKISLEMQELKNRTLNAEVIKEGLGFFEQAWFVAEPNEKKELFRLFIHRIIWTPDKIKMGLYIRPISEITV